MSTGTRRLGASATTAPHRPSVTEDSSNRQSSRSLGANETGNASSSDYHQLSGGPERKDEGDDEVVRPQTGSGVRWGHRAKKGELSQLQCRDSPCALFFVVQVVVVLGLLIFYYVDCKGEDSTFNKVLGRTQLEVAMLCAMTFVCTMLLSGFYYFFIGLFSRSTFASIFIHALVIGGVIAWGVKVNLKVTLGTMIPYSVLVVLYLISARKSIPFSDALLSASIRSPRRRCSTFFMSLCVSAFAVIYAYILLCVYVAFPELTHALFSGDPDEVKYSYYLVFYYHVFHASAMVLSLIHTVVSTSTALWWWHDDGAQRGGLGADDEWIVVLVDRESRTISTHSASSNNVNGNNSSRSIYSGGERGSTSSVASTNSDAGSEDHDDYHPPGMAQYNNQPAGALGINGGLRRAESESKKRGDDDDDDGMTALERNSTTLRAERLDNRDRMLAHITNVPQEEEDDTLGDAISNPRKKRNRKIVADAVKRGIICGLVKLSLTLHLGSVVWGAMLSLFIELWRIVFITRHPDSILGKILLCFSRISGVLMRLSNVFAFPYSILQNVTFFRASRDSVEALAVHNLFLVAQSHLAHFVLFTGFVFVNVSVGAITIYSMHHMFNIDDVRANTIEFTIIIVTSLVVSMLILTPIYSAAVGSMLVWALDHRSMRSFRPLQYDSLKKTKKLMPLSSYDGTHF